MLQLEASEEQEQARGAADDTLQKQIEDMKSQLRQSAQEAVALKVARSELEQELRCVVVGWPLLPLVFFWSFFATYVGLIGTSAYSREVKSAAKDLMKIHENATALASKREGVLQRELEQLRSELKAERELKVDRQLDELKSEIKVDRQLDQLKAERELKPESEPEADSATRDLSPAGAQPEASEAEDAADERASTSPQQGGIRAERAETLRKTAGAGAALLAQMLAARRPADAALEAQVRSLQGELRQSAEEMAALHSRLQQQETMKSQVKSQVAGLRDQLRQAASDAQGPVDEQTEVFEQRAPSPEPAPPRPTAAAPPSKVPAVGGQAPEGGATAAVDEADIPKSSLCGVSIC